MFFFEIVFLVIVIILWFIVNVDVWFRPDRYIRGVQRKYKWRKSFLGRKPPPMKFTKFDLWIVRLMYLFIFVILVTRLFSNLVDIKAF